MTDHTKRRPARAHCPLGHVTVMAAVLLTSFCSAAKSDEAPSQSGSGFDFAVVDTDGSGCVQGPEEMQKFRLHVAKILEESLKLSNLESALRAGLITHSADVNGDGKICECDLLSILLADSTASTVTNKHAFRVNEDGSIFDGVDADDDGFLGNAKELEGLTQKLAQCVSEDRARRVIDAMSKLDKEDGKLSREEYMLFLKSSLNIGTTPAPQPQPLPKAPGPQPGGDPAQAHQGGSAADDSEKQKPAAAGAGGDRQDSPRESSLPVEAGARSPGQQNQQHGLAQSPEKTPEPHLRETAQPSSSPIHPGQGFPPGSHPAKRPAQVPPPPANLENRPVIKPLNTRSQPQQDFSLLGLPSRRRALPPAGRRPLPPVGRRALPLVGRRARPPVGRRALPPVGRRNDPAVSGNKPEGLPIPPMVLASQPRPVFRQMNAASRPAQLLTSHPSQVFRRRMLTNQAKQQHFQPPLLQHGQFFHVGGSSRAENQPKPQPPVRPAADQPPPPPLRAAHAALSAQPARPAQPTKQILPQPKITAAPAQVESEKNPLSQPQKTTENPQPAMAEAEADNTKSNGSADKGGKKVDAE